MEPTSTHGESGSHGHGRKQGCSTRGGGEKNCHKKRTILPDTFRRKKKSRSPPITKRKRGRGAEFVPLSLQKKKERKGTPFWRKKYLGSEWERGKESEGRGGE